MDSLVSTENGDTTEIVLGGDRLVGGSLGGTLKLIEIGFTQDGLSVGARDIEFALGLRCLLISKVCIESLSVENLNVDLDESTAAARDSKPIQHEEDSVDVTEFEFPVALEIASIVVGTTEINWTGGGLRSGPVEGAITASERQLVLNNWRGSDTTLSIIASGDSEAAPDESIDLPKLSLPFEFLVTGLTLDSPSWSFEQTRHQHRSLALDLRWLDTTLTFDKFFVSSDGWGHARQG